jgi:hypothetical protein
LGEVTNEAGCGACEALLDLLFGLLGGFLADPRPALPLRFGDSPAGFFAQGTSVPPEPGAIVAKRIQRFPYATYLFLETGVFLLKGSYYFVDHHHYPLIAKANTS